MHLILKLLHVPIDDPWLIGIIQAGVVTFFVLLLLVGSVRIIRPLLMKVAKAVNAQVDENMVHAFLNLFRKIVVVVGAGMAITSLPLSRETEIFIHDTIFVVVAFFLLIAFFDVANILAMLVKRKAPEFETLVSRILKILFATIVLMVTMQHFDYSIMHILTALGVGTLAVGLAAQPTLTNMIAGFTILIDRPFRRGDRIALSATEIGDVVNIGMRSTHILNTDGNMLVVSNSDLVTSRLVNFNFPNHIMNKTVKFYVSNNGDFQEIKNILKGIAESTPGIAKGSGVALLSGMNEWGAEISVSFNVEHFSQNNKATDALIDGAVLEFRKRGITLATSPFPPPPAKH
jgi:MscS family membrane protein